MTTLTGARVVFVSGKGGVGKTTVAAALAVAAARAGKQVLLAELEDRVAFAPLFGKPRLSHVEQALARNIHGISIEADQAMVDYLKLSYGIPAFSRTLVRSKAVEFATHTAPGLKDILLIGTIREAESPRLAQARRYDLIVVDAPPTGRLPRFLEAPRAVAELARGGPIRSQAEGVRAMVLDPKRAQVVLVTLPEEMPARETGEAIETLEKIGVALGPIVVNQVYPKLDGLGRAPARTLRTNADEAGLAIDDTALGALAEIAASHARRARAQHQIINAIKKDADQAVIELPFLFTERIARAEVESLADVLEDHL